MKDTLILEYKLRTYETLPEHIADKKSKFAIYLHDELIGIVKSPIHDGARLLIQMGFSPDTLMTTRSKDSQNCSWKPQPLSKWAKLTTQELDHRQVRVRSFTECPRVGVLEGVRDFSDPTYLNNTMPPYAPPVGTESVTL